ncbi:UDP-N-acetylmuramoyl-tripeptide--D-alanyl-D-alanine ligase [Comamonas nitrativorans]|uniref:UDP-N-acetylmuramoyl-tripeptide--D-alanyl-D-alanine ligase n=1 Tax=Comamonas nitrativorans TaxID=108437 RepID=A0ABV9GXU2_9BURK
MMTLAQAAAWIAPSRPLQNADAGRIALRRVHTDSRSVQPGDLFVALRGERMDAHDFLAQAQAAGAVAAVVEPGRSLPGLPCIEAADTTAALGALAAGWRSQFSLPLIAVTGSNGKTTVTQMLASILTAAAGEGGFATRGNFNNAIGVPLTLLRLTGQHRLGVVELGMNHPGEIAELARIARPTVALVNNAQREHQEFMHTVQAVAEENGSVLGLLPPDGVAVFPADDAFTALWRSLAGPRKVLTFGGTDADVQVPTAIWQGDGWQVEIATPAGAFATRLHIAGRHNVRNALAATACALAAGVPLAAIAQGLQDFVPVQGRSRALALLWQGRTVALVDDTYNANPDSVQAAIAVLAELPAPRLLVLGDMGEVGDQGPAFHAEVGASARAAGIDKLIALGPQSQGAVAAFGPAGWHGSDMAAVQVAVQAAVQAGAASVLVKGSRSMRMEQVVQALQAASTEQGAAVC